MTPDSTPLLEVRGLAVSYGEARAVEEVSLTLDRGTILALIGANGAGKSTTLKAISGVVRPRRGQIVFDGRSILGEPIGSIVRRGIAHCPEGRRVFPFMTVRENLALGAFTEPDRSVVRRRTERAFALFPRLAERQSQLAGTLSGGEQQMLAIGRALMSGPKLLLLDEPTLGLAPIVADQVADLILRLRREGLSVVLVEQNAEMALALSDIAHILEAGRIVASGRPDDLRDADVVRGAYLGGE